MKAIKPSKWKIWGLVLAIGLISSVSWFLISQDCAICNIGKDDDNPLDNSSRIDITPSNAYQKIFSSHMDSFDLILDVRTESEYDEGHLENAILIPYDEIGENIDNLLPYQNLSILVYCRSGRRSGIASDELVLNNFTIVYNMLGGINEWTSAGYPVES